MTHQITTERDAGGLRQFLDGKPLHAGTPVQVFLPDEGTWLSGHYEWSFRETAPACVVIPKVGTLMLLKDVTVRRNA